MTLFLEKIKVALFCFIGYGTFLMYRTVYTSYLVDVCFYAVNCKTVYDISFIKKFVLLSLYI